MTATILRKNLSEAFVEGGIQDTNFFNGRLLTAKDLITLQDASRRRDRQLGLAVGAGIVTGLEVRLVADGADGNPPVLALTQGLAFNRSGQALALAQDVEVRLTEEPTTKVPSAGRFDVCLPPQQQGQPLPGKGAYLLVARPAADLFGQAPRRGFGQDAKVEGCDRDTLLEGIQFRIVELDLTKFTRLSQSTRNAISALFTATATDSLSKLRNVLAHLCLGTVEHDELIRNLLPTPPALPEFDRYGAADALTAAGVLDDCDVPLALFFWNTTGVKFVDNWALRRRPIQHTYGEWDGIAGERLPAEGEAAFLQFQAQIAELTRPTVLQSQLVTVQAKSYFRYLPAAGIIPFTTGAGGRGFDLLAFFNGMTVRDPIFIEARKVRPLLRMSFDYQPADVESGEMLWLYLVRQNRQPLAGSPTLAPQPYIIFAHGHVPFQGDAQFDLSYWSGANYSAVRVGKRSTQ